MHVCAGTVQYMSRAINERAGCRCSARPGNNPESNPGAGGGSPKVGWPWCNPFIVGIMSWNITLLYVCDSPSLPFTQQQHRVPDSRFDFGWEKKKKIKKKSYQQVSERLKSQGTCTYTPTSPPRGHGGHTVVKTFESAAPKQGAQRYKSQANSWVKLSAHTHMLTPQAAWRYIAVNGGKNVWVLDSFFPTIDCSAHQLYKGNCSGVCAQCDRGDVRMTSHHWEINSVHVSERELLYFGACDASEWVAQFYSCTVAKICSPDAAQVATVTTQCIAKLWLPNVLAPVGFFFLTISVPPPPKMDGQTEAMSKITYFCYYTSMQCTYCMTHWFQHRKYFLKSRTVVLHLLEGMMVFWLPQWWQRRWFITHKSNVHHNVSA